MKRIGKIFEIIKLVANKERRGTLTDPQIITAVEMAHAELYEELLEKYLKTKIMPNPLRAFMEETPVTFTAGASSVIAGLYELTGFKTNTGRNAEQVLIDEEWVDLDTSDLIAPTVKYPVVKLDGDPAAGFRIKILPSDIPSGTAYYLTMPTSWFNYDYTVATRGTTYNDGASTDTLFGETEIRKLVMLALPYLGIKFQNEALVGLTQLKADK